MPDESPDLERRTATVSVDTAVAGYPNLRLLVDGLKITVEGEPETVPADCMCGHGADAHTETFERDSRSGGRVIRECGGLDRGDEDGLERDAVQRGCDCTEYEPAHEPREIAFRVERLVEVEFVGRANVYRKAKA
jgi:hypothetical protein